MEERNGGLQDDEPPQPTHQGNGDYTNGYHANGDQENGYHEHENQENGTSTDGYHDTDSVRDA